METENTDAKDSGEATPQKKSSDVEHSEADILAAAGYDSLPVTGSAYVVSVQGRLQKHDDNTVGFLESAIRVTKNYTGPKIEYLVGAGLVKVNSGETPLEKVDFTVFGAEVAAHVSTTSAGFEAKLVLAGGRASVFDVNVGVGVSSGIGIIDDSLSLKVFGSGFQLGRKVGFSFFDTSFAIDFGRLYN